MNPLESRKQLLIAESELNRSQLAGDLTALGRTFAASPSAPSPSSCSPRPSQRYWQVWRPAGWAILLPEWRNRPGGGPS
jgi:hypothetical protein